MIEMRFKVVKWTEYPEFGTPLPHTEEPVLQYRYVERNDIMRGTFFEGCIGSVKYSEWKDVETEYIEE